MKVISFSEAINSLKTVLNRVTEEADYTIITRQDADDAVVMSLEFFNSLFDGDCPFAQVSDKCSSFGTFYCSV